MKEVQLPADIAAGMLHDFDIACVETVLKKNKTFPTVTKVVEKFVEDVCSTVAVSADISHPWAGLDAPAPRPEPNACPASIAEVSSMGERVDTVAALARNGFVVGICVVIVFYVVSFVLSFFRAWFLCFARSV